MPVLLRRRFASFLLTVAADGCGVASAQVPPSIEGIVRPLMETHRVPGVGIAVIKGGAIAWTASFGVGDVRGAQPVDAQTLFQGFPGYLPGTPLPSLHEILDGQRPTNTPAVKVVWPPGESFRYSGGGTMVLQQLVNDVTGTAFESLVRELVIEPVGMSRSRFA
jgi:CubicO group peptidase (beta-lactamase class C family)